MHGSDYEKYVCMDVSANASLYERNVTSAKSSETRGGEAMDSGVCIPKLDEPKKKEQNGRAEIQLVIENAFAQ